MLYSCKPLFERIKAEVVGKIDRLPFEGDAPRVAIIQCGEDEPSSRYIRNKLRDFAEVGILADVIRYPDTVELLTVQKKVFELGNDPRYCGVLVQRPVLVGDASQRDAAEGVVEVMDPRQDIDGAMGISDFLPPSVRGLDILLKEWDIDPAGKSAVVIGRGEVGRPVAEYLIGRDATVTVCHSRTPEDVLEDAIQCSDICIGAADMDELLPVSGWPGTVVVDYGIKPGPDGKLHGNFAQSDMTNIDRSIRQTPVPGGMGLMVRAGLLLNIVDAKKRRG